MTLNVNSIVQFDSMSNSDYLRQSTDVVSTLFYRSASYVDALFR